MAHVGSHTATFVGERNKRLSFILSRGVSYESLLLQYDQLPLHKTITLFTTKEQAMYCVESVEYLEPLYCIILFIAEWKDFVKMYCIMYTTAPLIPLSFLCRNYPRFDYLSTCLPFRLISAQIDRQTDKYHPTSQ